MENYEIYSILGKGTYAIVYGGIHKVNSKHFALKVFNLNTPTHIVRNEVQVMRHLMTYKIDNVVEVEEIFTNDNGQYVLVMEKLAGGELFDRIIERGSFSERDAAACMKTFIHALHKLHTQVGLIHRDLKPENIVYIDRTRNSDIKIVDFGLSIICNPTNAATGVICKDMVGTIGYMAPESIQRLCYSAESDVWSAGVILYCILTGIPPFNSEDKHISQRIVHGQYYPMNTTYWDGISEEAKDLVKQMLTVDPMKRITVQGVLNHPWITQHTSIASNVNLGAQYIKRIAKLSSRQKFRKVVNGIIWANRLRKSHLWGILSKGTANNDANALTKASSKVSTKLSKTESKAAKETDENVVPDEEPKQIQYFTNEQLNLLRQKFVTAAKQSAINRANTNANSSNPDTNTATTENEDIGYDEFCSIVESVGLNVLAHPHVFRLFDNDGNGRVDYREFLMSLTAFRDTGEDSLRLCFDIFDADGSGEISLQELKSVMASVMSDSAMDTLMIPITHRTINKDDPIQPPMKVSADDENLTALFNAIDTNGDGFVSFDEFRAWVGNDLSALQAIFIDPMTKALETS